MRTGIRWGGAGILIGTLASLALPRAGTAQQSDQAAVMAVVRTLFDGMRDKDSTKLASVWHPEARLQSTGRDAQGNPTVTNIDVRAFSARIVSMKPKVDEVTFDEEVMVNEDLAMVWAPYNVFVDGEFGHCGVDAFQMVRTADGWKILQLADTETQKGCDPSRRGG